MIWGTTSQTGTLNTPAICKHCRKRFIMPDGPKRWVYRDGNRRYCTYNCMLRYREKHWKDKEFQTDRKRYLFNLAGIMNYFGITVNDLGNIMHLNRYCVLTIRNTEIKATGKEIDLLCELFGCTEEELAGYHEPAKSQMALWEVDWERIDEAKKSH